MRWLDGITVSGHELGQTPRDGERLGGLVHCSPWGCSQSDTTLVTEQEHLDIILNWASLVAQW